tara:strand:+ start:870 stop:1154 length:285 start_codon:yes stop_codon:yes gene_type:complete
MKIPKEKIEKIIQEEVQRAIRALLEASDSQQAYVGDVSVDVSPEQRAQMINDKIASDLEDEKDSCQPGSDSSQCRSDHDEVEALQKARSDNANS